MEARPAIPLLGGSSDGTARLWDAASGQPRGELAGHLYSVWWLGFNRQGRRIETHGGAADARFSPDGERVVVALIDRTALIYPLAGAVTVALAGHRLDVHGAALSPDGDRVVTTSADRTARDPGRRARRAARDAVRTHARGAQRRVQRFGRSGGHRRR